jgi:FHA domain
MISEVNIANKPISTNAKFRASGESKTVWILAAVGTQATDTLTVIHPVPFSIGRKAGCSLQLPSKSVSSHHADLTVRDGQLTIIDRKSTNGTFVNGRRVSDVTTLKSPTWHSESDATITQPPRTPLRKMFVIKL